MATRLSNAINGDKKMLDLTVPEAPNQLRPDIIIMSLSILTLNIQGLRQHNNDRPLCLGSIASSQI